MKYLLPILAVLLASGYAYGADRMSGSSYGSDRMITNDDLQNAVPDSDGSTFNRMPQTQESEGSAAGGIGKDSDSMGKESDQEGTSGEKTPEEPAKEPVAPEPYVMPGY